MGIPYYFSYIIQNHSKIIKKIQDIVNVDNLYLDCNSIIYDSINYLEKLSEEVSEDKIIQQILKNIDNYILTVKPSNIIFIAFDGIAPVAKLEQQRQRRYKTLYQKQIYNNIFKINTEKFNTSLITPGTEFMNLLNENIINYFSAPDKYNENNVILSLSDEIGEGEHKIFNYIRENAKDLSESVNIVYGLDADLIMLCMNHISICKHIYLYRETPTFIKDINKSLDPNFCYLLDMMELSSIISNNMGKHIIECVSPQLKNENPIYDYIFLCFLLGNDFLPHFPSINIRTGGIHKLLNAYQYTLSSPHTFLINNNKIQWKNVRKLIFFLLNQEEKYLEDEMKLRDKQEKNNYYDNHAKQTPETCYKLFETSPCKNRTIEKYINPPFEMWEYRYYKILFNIEPDESRIKQICLNYLEGLEWNYKYYSRNCPNWRWSYKYNYPPLLKDLYKYIPYFEVDLIGDHKINPVSNTVQLCYVLPLQTLQCINKPVCEALLKYHPEWYEYDNKFIWAFCKYFWECHAELPYININDLEYFIHNIIKNKLI
jgi:5'-3' exoribonuclease 1